MEPQFLGMFIKVIIEKGNEASLGNIEVNTLNIYILFTTGIQSLTC